MKPYKSRLTETCDAILDTADTLLADVPSGNCSRLYLPIGKIISEMAVDKLVAFSDTETTDRIRITNHNRTATDAYEDGPRPQARLCETGIQLPCCRIRAVDVVPAGTSAVCTIRIDRLGDVSEDPYGSRTFKLSYASVGICSENFSAYEARRDPDAWHAFYSRGGHVHRRSPGQADVCQFVGKELKKGSIVTIEIDEKRQVHYNVDDTDLGCLWTVPENAGNLSIIVALYNAQVTILPPKDLIKTKSGQVAPLAME